MIYSLAFFCISGMICVMSPEITQYEELYIYHDLEVCKEAAGVLQVQASPGIIVGCQNQSGIVEWIGEME
jgi:hypothetical protein